MRKFALLFAVVAAVGCGGSSSDISVNRIRPTEGTYTGDGSITTQGSSTIDTAPVQSATVDSAGNSHIVVGPFNGEADTTYTIDGNFGTDRIFRGTVSTDGVTNHSFAGSYRADTGEFELSIPAYPAANQSLTVLGQRQIDQ